MQCLEPRNTEEAGGPGKELAGQEPVLPPRRQEPVKDPDLSGAGPACSALRSREPFLSLQQSNMIEDDKGRLFRQQILRCIETGRPVSRKA